MSRAVKQIFVIHVRSKIKYVYINVGKNTFLKPVLHAPVTRPPTITLIFNIKTSLHYNSVKITSVSKTIQQPGV